MSDYPVPRYAASVWVTGETLWLAFPAIGVGEYGHSVPFKIDLSALRALSTDHKELRGIVLALDALVTRHAESAIGTRGSPVRWDIERAVSNDKRYREWLKQLEMTKEEIAERDKWLKEVGL